MATKTLYADTITDVNKDVIPYRKISSPANLKTSSKSSVAHWGATTKSSAGSSYQNAIAGKNGSHKHPSTIRLTDYGAGLPANAKVSNIKVEYYYYKGQYTSPIGQTSYGEFAGPKITMLGVSGLSKTGTSPPKEDISTDAQRTKNVNFSVNLKGSDVNKTGFGVQFDLPANTNTNPCYISIAYVRIILTYTAESYTPKITVNPSSGTYGNKFTATCSLSEINKVKSSGTVKVNVTIPSGVKVDSVSSVQGSYSDGVWTATTKDYSSKLVLILTPTGASVSGSKKVELKELEGNNTASATITLTAVNYTPIVSISGKYLEISSDDDTDEIVYLNIKVKSSATTNTTISLNIGIPSELRITDENVRDKIVNNLYTISSWDSNKEHSIKIPLRGLVKNDETTPYKVTVSSGAFTTQYSFDVFVNRPETTGLYFTSFRLPTFSYDNMEDGHDYVFACFARYNGAFIDKSNKNLRIVVLNGEAPVWSEQVDKKNEWVVLETQFTYNASYPVEIQLYGDYIDFDGGDPWFSNFCLVDADYYNGYERPVFHLSPLSNLLNNSLEWASLIFSPPEKTRSTKHYLNTFDYQNLLEAEKIIIQGVGIEMDTEFDEEVGLTIGIGKRGSNINDFFFESTSVTSGTTEVKFGGKYENWGVPFQDLQKFLPDLEITLELDDNFDDETEFESKITNLRLVVYYSDDKENNCGFSINGVHCKYYNITMNKGTIPQGSNFDINNLVIEGGDGEEPTRANIRSKTLKPEISFDDECFIEAQNLKNYIVKYLTPKRGRSDEPIPNKIVFDFEPDRYYEYVIENAFDFEPTAQGFKGPIELKIPKGVATSMTSIKNEGKGNIKGNGKTKPLIYIKKTYYEDDPEEEKKILVKDSFSGQIVLLKGAAVDKLATGTRLLIDSENLLVYYYEQFEETDPNTGDSKTVADWKLLDLECVDVSSQFFILQEQFNFEAESEGCIIDDIVYYNTY